MANRVISKYNHDRAHNGWQFLIQDSATGATIHASDAVYRSRAEAEHYGNFFAATIARFAEVIELDDIDYQCDACGGELVQLGVLGSLSHLRCRQCGSLASREATIAPGSLHDLI